ncbi:hypothetical protein [Streptomyces sp. CA-111067]|uniref:hypothetical protein n=1 Tax=Streptomyces sp. CA-111067 TaxID=3240046 RepID=UPI003D95489A
MDQGRMDLADRLAMLDRLRVADLPAQRAGSGGVRGGPGFLLADLAVGADPHVGGPGDREQGEDREHDERREQDEADFAADCQALVDALAGRWGEPEAVHLTPYLERAVAGQPVPEPMVALSAIVPEAYGWQVADRWIALGVGRWDQELPSRLVLLIAGVHIPRQSGP